jgi:hypothetical protein
MGRQGWHPVFWVKPENAFVLQVCAVDVCLDMHQRCAVYTFSPDVGQCLEKMCIQLGCAHELTFFPRFGRWIEKKDMAYFFLRQEFSWFGGLLDTCVSFLEKRTSQV